MLRRTQTSKVHDGFGRRTWSSMQTKNGKNEEEKNEIAHGAIVNELNRNRIGQAKRNIPAPENR
ncbi:hypothetical protein SKTS_32560 [Sulfurimicrobium lacus]|uniref:Uncharacterized protein n=1 Tax=Sulfurimicrobium lacus TaxID=2715678 RepID=A0A6F8VGA0_9PROT|nr:hypothetical protein SKTS_32560 [Sulfurimicrobium lacus]